MKLSKRITAGTLSALMIAGSLTVTGCSKNYVSPKNDSEALVVTVGDSKIYMDEAKCYIFVEEVNGQYMNEVYAAYMGVEDFWGQEVSEDDDRTNAKKSKDDTLDQLIENQILLSVAEGYDDISISEAEEKKIEENAQKLIDLLSDRVKKKTGFEKEDFVNFQKKLNIAKKCKEKIVEEFNVTEESVEDGLDYDNDLKQYKTTYIRIATTVEDSDGNETDLPTEQKELIKNTMLEIKTKLATGTSFSDLAKEYEEDGAESNALNYTQGNLDELEDSKSEDTDADEEYMKQTSSLKKGAISDVFEADGFYYIVQMDDNDSEDAYNKAVDNAVTEEEDKQYEEWLKKQKEGDYSYTVNDEVWDEIEMGDLTIEADEIKKALGTLEDPAKATKEPTTTTTTE